ncbi:MAG: hypothetical protein ACR2L2_15780 [Acidobacteriota bacterium]
MYFEALRALGLLEVSDRKPSPPGPEPLLLNSVVEGTVRASSDPNQDVEPAVIAIDIDGTTHTTTTYIKYVTESNLPRIYFSKTVVFGNYIEGQLSVPADYAKSGDPFLAQNPFTDGVAPKRMYNSGVVFNSPCFTAPSGIAVWYSDSGGYPWSSAVVLARSDIATIVLDKPDIEVSQAPTSRGWVYVAFVQFDCINPNVSVLKIYRSSDGGASFQLASSVITGNVWSPQVLVNPFFGNVYVIWTDMVNKQIWMARSTDVWASTWTYELVANVDPVSGSINNGTINGEVRAITSTSAKFNSVANSICVVWHEREPGSPPDVNRTDVYFQSKTGSGWLPTKVLIDDNPIRDQFHPALDYDGTGRLMVAWYDRVEDPTNFKYHQYVTYITTDGTRLQNKARVSTFDTDPFNFTPIRGFVGDYQDMWLWTYGGTQKYVSAWVGMPSWLQGSEDIFLSRILP